MQISVDSMSKFVTSLSSLHSESSSGRHFDGSRGHGLDEDTDSRIELILGRKSCSRGLFSVTAAALA